MDQNGDKKMSKPTQKDAELLLQLLKLTNNEESREAYRWFWEEFDVKSHRKFKKKYPSGSRGSGFFNRFMSNWEMLATLVVNGLISEDLIFDMFFVKPFWMKAELIVYGLRKEWKSPRLYENIEVLVQKEAEWEKTHSPKVKTSDKKK
jgi:hypothetical protein